MADEAIAPATVVATSTVEVPTTTSDDIAQPAVAETKPAEGGTVATTGVAEVPQSDEPQGTANATGGDAVDATTDAATDTIRADVRSTPIGKKAANGKRKSISSVPEHKKKTPGKGKKKVVPELRLNISPGDMFMVAMRGYQPWPVIMCDEEMLPESLLSKRPVSAQRIDGTYREDYMEGGKNAKDRRYPVMFLGTNEFAWQVNSELLNFDIDEVKQDVESGNQGKKNKALWDAYHIAAEGHELSHFKQMLQQHEQAMQDDLELREQKLLQKKEKADRAAKRKSIVVEESDDVDMEDAGHDTAPSAKKTKATKKRKKGADSDGENENPSKTPKTKLKLTTKTPKDSSTPKAKKEPKGKKKASQDVEVPVPEEPPMTEEERLQKREKQVLYLRHRLQKGFLSRDQAPKDEDMLNMSDYLKQLEIHDDLEAEVIKKTKVHKVLKAIIKLDSIPKEEEYSFKQRSNDLLGKWNGALAAENEQATAKSATEPSTNGVKHGSKEKTGSPNAESPIDKATNAEKKSDSPTDALVSETIEIDEDVAIPAAAKDSSVSGDAALITGGEMKLTSNPAITAESNSATA